MIERELKNKFENIDSPDFEKIEVPKSDNSRFTTYELKKEMANLKEEMLLEFIKMNLDEERYKKIGRDIADLQRRMESFVDLEKRVNKIFKDADINNLVR